MTSDNDNIIRQQNFTLTSFHRIVTFDNSAIKGKHIDFY